MSRRSDPTTDDLDELVSAFARWRGTRRTRTGATPERLRHRVVALLDTHRPATIARALAISPVAIERWANEMSSPRVSCIAASPDFVALPADDGIVDERMPGVAPSAAPENALPELALRWPGGATLIARGAIPRTALAAILEAFAAPGTGTPERPR